MNSASAFVHGPSFRVQMGGALSAALIVLAALCASLPPRVTRLSPAADRLLVTIVPPGLATVLNASRAPINRESSRIAVRPKADMVSGISAISAMVSVPTSPQPDSPITSHVLNLSDPGEGPPLDLGDRVIRAAIASANRSDDSNVDSRRPSFEATRSRNSDAAREGDRAVDLPVLRFCRCIQFRRTSPRSGGLGRRQRNVRDRCAGLVSCTCGTDRTVPILT